MTHLLRTTTLFLDPQMMDSWDLRFSIQGSVSTVLQSVSSLSLFLFNQTSIVFSSSIWAISLIVNFTGFDVYNIQSQFFTPSFLSFPLSLLSLLRVSLLLLYLYFFCLGRTDVSLRIHNSTYWIIISHSNQSIFQHNITREVTATTFNFSLVYFWDVSLITVLLPFLSSLWTLPYSSPHFPCSPWNLWPFI